MWKVAKCDLKRCNGQEKSTQRKNFGFSDLSSFGREMLYVKVGTDKRKERIWDLRGAVPLWSGNAECKMSHLVRGGRQTQQKKQSANKGKQFQLKGYFLCFCEDSRVVAKMSYFNLSLSTFPKVYKMRNGNSNVQLRHRLLILRCTKLNISRNKII